MKNIPFSPPDITDLEIAEVVDTLKSGWITTGPKTKRFEEEISLRCGTKRSAALASATAAMECTLRILGIGEGDEVIVPAYTYTASASVVYHCGAKIVMCDVGDDFHIDYDKIGALITKNTKAIIPVDIGGVMCEYDKIIAVLESQKALFTPKNDIQKAFGRVIILADGAHSFGAKAYGISSGSAADFTAFSFHAVKNLTTAEGGAVTWKSRDFIDDDLLYKKYMLQSLHGQNKDALAKSKMGGWEYDISAPLYKCNMTDIQAAIGLAQMKRYDDILAKRKEFIGIYNEILCDEKFHSMVHFDKNHQSSGHLYLLRIDKVDYEKRGEIIEKMAENGIATNVHYKPLPRLSAYKNLGYDIKDYPNADALFQNEITLPLNTKMTQEDVRFVAQTLKKSLDRFFNK